MNIIITGALGHIGSELIRNIDDLDFDNIILIDNLSSQRYSSLFNLPVKKNVNFLNLDISKVDISEHIASEDIVVHLAAITNASASINNKSQVEENNLSGTINASNAALKNKAKLIFPSSTSVYGTSDTIVYEDSPMNNLKPQSPYAETKLSEERYISSLGEQGLRYIICRFGTIFGPSIGMRFHTAVNKFCFDAVLGQKIEVWETAYNQFRPYLGLNDCIMTIKFIIEKNLFLNSRFNILTANYTVKDIIDSISKVINKTEIKFVKSEIMNQLSYKVSNEKFKSTGFEFRDDLDNEIRETLKLFSPFLRKKFK